MIVQTEKKETFRSLRDNDKLMKFDNIFSRGKFSRLNVLSIKLDVIFRGVVDAKGLPLLSVT